MPSKAKDYSKALIYKICCLDTNVKEIYVGSTTDIIRRRYKHKTTCNNPNDKHYNFKVYQHMRAFGGWDNWNMVLIEFYPCNNILELGRREDFWKQELKSVLNTYAPPMYETKQEYMIEYREVHREEIAENKRDYYEANKEQIAEKKKDYYEANKEDIAEQTKKWYEANKEQIAEKNKQKHTCECGSIYRSCDKARHEKSKKHQKYLEEKQKNNISA